MALEVPAPTAEFATGKRAGRAHPPPPRHHYRGMRGLEVWGGGVVGQTLAITTADSAPAPWPAKVSRGRSKQALWGQSSSVLVLARERRAGAGGVGWGPVGGPLPVPAPTLDPSLPPCRSCCWRRGPASKPILCNACGSRYLVKRSLDGYQPLQTRREQSAAREAAAGGAPKEPQRRAAPTAASGRTTKPKRAAQKRWVVPQLGVDCGVGLGADFRHPLAGPTNHMLSSTPLTTSFTLLPLLLQACRLRRLEQRP